MTRGPVPMTSGRQPPDPRAHPLTRRRLLLTRGQHPLTRGRLLLTRGRAGQRPSVKVSPRSAFSTSSAGGVKRSP
jgi:hypothetical protein